MSGERTSLTIVRLVGQGVELVKDDKVKNLLAINKPTTTNRRRTLSKDRGKNKKLMMIESNALRSMMNRAVVCNS